MTLSMAAIVSLGLVGGELLGVPVGALAGETVGGPPGALGGGILGGLFGAPGGFLIGGFGGAYAGVVICNGGETACDTLPRVIPFPKPEPRATPLFPPWPTKPGEICLLKEKQGLFCTYQCKDGFTFQTFTSTGDKYGDCPAAAARPPGL
jgi:hypothetical protein